MEKPSRAIGLKKTKGARGDEPAESTPPRENEPGGIITPQMSTTNYVKSPRENEPGENSFGRFGMKTLKGPNGITKSIKVKEIFGIVTRKMVLCWVMSWQKTVVAGRTCLLSPSVVPHGLPKRSRRSTCCHGPYIRCQSQCRRCRRGRWMMLLRRR